MHPTSRTSVGQRRGIRHNTSAVLIDLHTIRRFDPIRFIRTVPSAQDRDRPDQIDHRLVSFHFIRRAGVSRVHCAVLCVVTIKVPRADQDRCRLSLPCLVTHCSCAKSLHNNQSNSGKSSRILVTRAVHALSTASHWGSPRDGPRIGQVKSSRSWARVRRGAMLCDVQLSFFDIPPSHHITSHLGSRLAVEVLTTTRFAHQCATTSAQAVHSVCFSP